MFLVAGTMLGARAIAGTYTVSGLPTQNAIVSVNGVLVDVPASGEISVAEGATVRVEPAEGYLFESFTATQEEPPVWNGSLETLSNDTTVVDGTTITGALAGNYKISIADGATVTLKNATINGASDDSFLWAGLTCEGDATIVLEGVNKVRGFHRNYPGLIVAVGKTLTIKGDGSLEVSSGGGSLEAGSFESFAAGIGSGYWASCGNIKIEGGTITATGGEYSAGIGRGYGDAAVCGDITIANTVKKVTVKKGAGAVYSIGNGDDEGTCGTVTIGGVVGAISASPYVYEP